jgi:hypothetical protein
MQRYRIAVVASLVLLLISAAVLSTWFWAKQALETGIAQWRAEQIERGFDIAYRGPDFAGFPFALSVSFREPRVTTPQGLTWQGPPIHGEAKLWDPFTVDLRFPGLHRLRLSQGGDERMADVAAEEARGQVVLQSGGGVESAKVDLGRLQLSGEDIETVSLERLTARLGPLRPGTEGSLDELDLVGEALHVSLPPGRGDLLGDSLARLSFDSTLVGGIPKGKPAESLPAWRDLGGRWRFHRLAVLWGPLDLQASGRLGLDDLLRPAGKFEAEVKGAGTIIDRLIAAKKIKPEAALAARLAVVAMGRPDAATGEPVLAAPVILGDGYLYLGPIPLLPLAPVL